MATSSPAAISTAPVRSRGVAALVWWPPPARERAFALVLVLMALAPVLVVIVTRFGHAYAPAGDIGLIDLRVREVFSSNPPLVGPYGNHGWSHPGPMVFYLLSLPALLTGLQAWGTQVAGALLQAGAVGWLAWLAWRRGRLPLLAVAMVGTSLLALATPVWVVRDPWNPHVALPFFALFVFQVWLVATGDARILPGAVAVGTLLVQTHVGYLPLVAGAAAVAVLCRVLDRRRTDRHWNGRRLGAWRRPVMWSLVISAVLWLPPVLESVLNPPGNLWEIAHYFLHPESSDNPQLGIAQGTRLLAAEFAPLPDWLGGAGDANSVFGLPQGKSSWALLIPVALLAVGIVVACRRRHRAAVQFLAVAAALVAVSCVALARIEEPQSLYLLLWRPAIAIVVVLGVGWALVDGSRFSGPGLTGRVGRAFGAVLTVVVMCWGSLGLARDVRGESVHDTPRELGTSSLARQALRHGVPAGGVILRLQWVSRQLQRGIYDELDRHGAPVFVDRSQDYQYADGRAADPSDVARVWWVAESGAALADLMSRPGARLIARWSSLPRRKEARARELTRQLMTELQAADSSDLLAFLSTEYLAAVTKDVEGVDHEAARELTSLNVEVDRSDGVRGGIVSFPPDAAPDEPAFG